MQTGRASDDPFSFSRAERATLLTLVLVGAIGLASGYWLAPLARWLAPAPIESVDSAYIEAVNAWIAQADFLADSVAEEREARRARAIARQSEWAAKRAGWAAEKAARAANRQRYARGDYSNAYRRSSGGWRDDPNRNTSFNRRYGDSSRQGAASISYDGPAPAEGSLDPNTVDSLTLRRLGLPIGLTRRWLKYRASGGSFVSAGDIDKLYGMPDSTARRIERFFGAPSVLTAPPTASNAVRQATTEAEFSASGSMGRKSREYRPPAIVEVNRATHEDLTTIRGIGDFYATRIIDYRGRLGGFLSVAQVAETPGLRDSTFTVIEPFLRIDTTYRFRIPLNTATKWQELRHPYMSIAAAKMAFAYREQHGPYRSAADLRKVKALNPEDIEALLPYLDFGL